MNIRTFKTLLNALFFGSFTGIILAVALAQFVPQFYTEWAGGLVCPGRVQYVIFKQTYLCYTSANDFFDLRDAMYWAVFKRVIFFTVPFGFLFVFGLMKLGAFLYQRREAAGF
ncbi:MAG TPA: hypothetical protein VIL74_19850 [Pyrinomonadaceae bacterium]|jgi:hypothetical protein